jgi:hypothetical protein
MNPTFKFFQYFAQLLRYSFAAQCEYALLGLSLV